MTAVGTPSHGWTAQPRSPGRGRLLGGDQPACNGTCLAVVGPCWRVLTHEDLPKIAAHRVCCHGWLAVRHGPRALSRCRTT